MGHAEAFALQNQKRSSLRQVTSLVADSLSSLCDMAQRRLSVRHTARVAPA